MAEPHRLVRATARVFARCLGSGSPGAKRPPLVQELLRVSCRVIVVAVCVELSAAVSETSHVAGTESKLLFNILKCLQAIGWRFITGIRGQKCSWFNRSDNFSRKAAGVCLWMGVNGDEFTFELLRVWSSGRGFSYHFRTCVRARVASPVHIGVEPLKSTQNPPKLSQFLSNSSQQSASCYQQLTARSPAGRRGVNMVQCGHISPVCCLSAPR